MYRSDEHKASPQGKIFLRTQSRWSWHHRNFSSKSSRRLIKTDRQWTNWEAREQQCQQLVGREKEFWSMSKQSSPWNSSLYCCHKHWWRWFILNVACGWGGGLYVHLLWLLLLCGALSQRKDEADQRGLGIASIEEQRSKVYRRACQCVLKIDTSRQ